MNFRNYHLLRTAANNTSRVNSSSSNSNSAFKSMDKLGEAIRNTGITIGDIREEKEEPFIVTYRSRPIQGIQLELVKLNPEYFKKKEDMEKMEQSQKKGNLKEWGIYERR